MLTNDEAGKRRALENTEVLIYKGCLKNKWSEGFLPQESGKVYSEARLFDQ